MGTNPNEADFQRALQDFERQVTEKPRHQATTAWAKTLDLVLIIALIVASLNSFESFNLFDGILAAGVARLLWKS